MKRCCIKTIAVLLCSILVLGLGNRMCYIGVKAEGQDKKQTYIVLRKTRGWRWMRNMKKQIRFLTLVVTV